MHTPKVGYLHTAYCRYINKQIKILETANKELLKENQQILKLLVDFDCVFNKKIISYNKLYNLSTMRVNNPFKVFIQLRGDHKKWFNDNATYFDRIKGKAYINTILSNISKWIKNNDKAKYYERYLIDSTLFAVAIGSFFYEISKFVLRGYWYRIGKNVGTIKLRELKAERIAKYIEENEIVNFPRSLDKLEELLTGKGDTDVDNAFKNYRESLIPITTLMDEVRPYTRGVKHDDWIVPIDLDTIPKMAISMSRYGNNLRRYLRFYSFSGAIKFKTKKDYENPDNYTIDDVINDCDIGIKNKVKLIWIKDRNYLNSLK